MEIKLKDYVGQVVTILLPDKRTMTGILATDGTNFGVNNLGFPESQFAELRVIEAPPEKNLVRLVAVLK